MTKGNRHRYCTRQRKIVDLMNIHGTLAALPRTSHGTVNVGVEGKGNEVPVAMTCVMLNITQRIILILLHAKKNRRLGTLLDFTLHISRIPLPPGFLSCPSYAPVNL